jgi:hypothetical protein
MNRRQHAYILREVFANQTKKGELMANITEPTNPIKDVPAHDVPARHVPAGGVPAQNPPAKQDTTDNGPHEVVKGPETNQGA